MARLKVFDTNAMVAVFHGHLVPDPEQVRVAISIISRLELRAWPRLSPAERTILDEILSQVDVQPIDSQIESLAVQVRLNNRLKLPDAIIAATAISLNSPLVTHDQVFSRVQSLVIERF